MAYSKLYSSIVHSSLWTEADHVRLLFITLLAIADREGFVYGSRHGIERLANIDPDAVERDNPWHCLMSPDRDSSDRLRNPENEGRRIEEVPGGFRILNFLYYRGLRNDDDRREQNKEAQRRHREKNHGKPQSATVSRDKPISEADAESKADADAEAIYSAYPKHVGRPNALKSINRSLKKAQPEWLLQKTQEYAIAVKGEDPRFIPHPATWFNQERYNDEPTTWKRTAPSTAAQRKAERQKGEYPSNIDMKKLLK